MGETVWFLESVAADGSHVKKLIHRLPFRVGREPGNDLAVDALGLSRHHAEIDLTQGGSLVVTDLGSTNGTFVNRERITQPRLLRANDVLHFGNAEYQLVLQDPAAASGTVAESDRTMLVPTKAGVLTGNFDSRAPQFMELLQGQGIGAAVQPIVRADNGALYAYELLGRSRHEGLPASPAMLFDLAKTLKKTVELSEAFRRFGVTAIAPRLNGARLFVNAHPQETFTDEFLSGLRRLCAELGGPKLVVELHESAVAETAKVCELKARLAEFGVEIAFDDFGGGTGQDRTLQLAEVRPHFVKFDMGLLHDIHLASEERRHVVREMVRLVVSLRGVPLAEGLELEQEAAVCREMGFMLIQGYLTGKPVPVEQV